MHLNFKFEPLKISVELKVAIWPCIFLSSLQSVCYGNTFVLPTSQRNSIIFESTYW